MADNPELLSAETEATQLPKRPSRRFAVFALLAAAALTAAALTYRASQWVPPFYQQTLVADRADLAAFGDDLERELLNLHSEINDDGHWEGVFSDEQINGWLAVDMLDKFPQLLPPAIKDPRVIIKDSQMHMACQYQNGGVSVVLSLAADVSLTERPNEIAVRLRNARIGAVPGLIRQAMPTISLAAIRSGVRIYWQQLENDPVAIVKIPVDVFDEGRDLIVESVNLTEGRLAVTGRVDAPEPEEETESPQEVTARESQPAKNDNRQL